MAHYKELKDLRQQEFNNLPIFYAFGREQFKQAMEERGLTENDTDKIYSLPGGGFYLRTDAQKIRDFFVNPDPVLEHMKDPVFAEEAFLYEMENHEYGINWQGDWDVCSVFGEVEYAEEKSYTDYLTELGYGEEIIKAYMNAKLRFYMLTEEKGWF